jgi:Protein of unknown function (DUF2894)
MNSGCADTSDVTARALAMLDAWREQGADRLDAVRFHFMVALARRAAGQSGVARQILDDRLAGLLDAYAAEIERAAVVADGDAGAELETGAAVLASATSATSASTVSASASDTPATESLSELVNYLAIHASTSRNGHPSGHERTAAAYPELPALDYFRDVWSKVRTEKQMRQSLAPVPGNAGPLNSSSLVHRSLSLMRELSPGYLKQFLTYVDTLSWMEQMTGGGAPAGKETPRSGSTGKGARGKAR